MLINKFYILFLIYYIESSISIDVDIIASDSQFYIDLTSGKIGLGGRLPRPYLYGASGHQAGGYGPDAAAIRRSDGAVPGA